ncbi:MAG: DNA starvation/stationary phase protection protein [Candidatus Babeliaceae bacterium]|jgi:starvation-inducible DNA-binding protein
MIKIALGISDKHRKEIAHILNVILSYEYVLYTKTLKYHWNVESQCFGPLHLLFKEQYEQLFSIIDDVAERVRSLGHYSLGTLTEFLQESKVEEAPGKYPNDMDMIADLLVGHEIIIRLIRKEIDSTLEKGDAGTSNFLTDIIEKHEKTAWMLRAHLL